jgi:hypothetical protein
MEKVVRLAGEDPLPAKRIPSVFFVHSRQVTPRPSPDRTMDFPLMESGAERTYLPAGKKRAPPVVGKLLIAP